MYTTNSINFNIPLFPGTSLVSYFFKQKTCPKFELMTPCIQQVQFTSTYHCFQVRHLYPTFFQKNCPKLLTDDTMFNLQLQLKTVSQYPTSVLLLYSYNIS